MHVATCTCVIPKVKVIGFGKDYLQHTFMIQFNIKIKRTISILTNDNFNLYVKGALHGAFIHVHA